MAIERNAELTDSGVDLESLDTLAGASRKAAAHGIGVFLREYRTQHGEDALPTDQTMSAVVTALVATAHRHSISPSTAVAVGDHMPDHERDEKTVLVTGTPALTAADYDIPETLRTVAQHNPTYPDSDPVIEAVYVEALDAAFGAGQWTATDILGMNTEGTLDQHVRTYAFPESRLTTNSSPSNSEGI